MAINPIIKIGNKMLLILITLFIPKYAAIEIAKMKKIFTVCILLSSKSTFLTSSLNSFIVIKAVLNRYVITTIPTSIFRKFPPTFSARNQSGLWLFKTLTP